MFLKVKKKKKKITIRSFVNHKYILSIQLRYIFNYRSLNNHGVFTNLCHAIINRVYNYRFYRHFSLPSEEELSEKLINNPLLSILPPSCQPHWMENYSRILTRIMQLAGRDLEHASGGEGI